MWEERDMKKEYKVLICILALIFSIGATYIGFGLIGSSSMKFGMKYVCDFVFLMQTMQGCYRIAQKVSLLEGFE